MPDLRKRKATFDLGADVEDIVADNTTAPLPEPKSIEEVAPTASKAPAVTRTTKRKPVMKPSPNPSDVGDDEPEAYTIPVRFTSAASLSEARAISEETGLPLKRVLAPKVQAATQSLREALQAGDTDRLTSGYKYAEALHTFRTSIYLTPTQAKLASSVVDPHGLLSRSKTLALAVSMHLED